MRIVATTSLPLVDRPNDDRWNAARSCQIFVCLRGDSALWNIKQRIMLEKVGRVQKHGAKTY